MQAGGRHPFVSHPSMAHHRCNKSATRGLRHPAGYEPPNNCKLNSICETTASLTASATLNTLSGYEPAATCGPPHLGPVATTAGRPSISGIRTSIPFARAHAAPGSRHPGWGTRACTGRRRPAPAARPAARAAPPRSSPRPAPRHTVRDGVVAAGGDSVPTVRDELVATASPGSRVAAGHWHANVCHTLHTTHATRRTPHATRHWCQQ